MEIDKQGDEARSRIRLDPASGVPTYLQLVRQVEDAIRLGYLVAGDQLPKVKDVVATLAINPNTVLKAYRELEHKGLAAGRPGPGNVRPGDASTSRRCATCRRCAASCPVAGRGGRRRPRRSRASTRCSPAPFTTLRAEGVIAS